MSSIHRFSHDPSPPPRASASLCHLLKPLGEAFEGGIADAVRGCAESFLGTAICQFGVTWAHPVNELGERLWICLARRLEEPRVLLKEIEDTRLLLRRIDDQLLGQRCSIWYEASKLLKHAFGV